MCALVYFGRYQEDFKDADSDLQEYAQLPWQEHKQAPQQECWEVPFKEFQQVPDYEFQLITSQFRLECIPMDFSDTKSDSEGVHHGVGVIIVSLKRRSKVYIE